MPDPYYVSYHALRWRVRDRLSEQKPGKRYQKPRARSAIMTAMNDDQLDDLKQFIDSRISQTEARLEERISDTETKLEQKIEDLQSEMRDGFAGVGEAIEDIHTQADKINVDVERRLASLERPAAA